VPAINSMIHTAAMFLTDNIKLVLCRVRGYKYHIPPYKILMPSPTNLLIFAITWKSTQRCRAGTIMTIHLLMTPVKLGYSPNIFFYAKFQGLTLCSIRVTPTLNIHIVPFRIIGS
jgi:hypothetical protein